MKKKIDVQDESFCYIVPDLIAQFFQFIRAVTLQSDVAIGVARSAVKEKIADFFFLNIALLTALVELPSVNTSCFKLFPLARRLIGSKQTCTRRLLLLGGAAPSLVVCQHSGSVVELIQSPALWRPSWESHRWTA